MPQPYRRKVNANGDSSKKVILINNFLGGLAWGLGTVIGATVIVAIVGAVLNSSGVLDSLKEFFEQFQALPSLYN